MSGTGWSCASGRCTRRDAFAGGSSDPLITVTVSVAQDASAQVTNVVSVSGGASASGAASDATTVVTVCGISGTPSAGVADVQQVVNEALGTLTAAHDLNHDGVIDVADVQKELSAALGLGCRW